MKQPTSEETIQFDFSEMRTSDIAGAITLGYLNFDNVIESYQPELRARIAALELELGKRRSK